ncbi:hypothetical protein ACVNF4_31305, partial [Streptomyces sp. S6]
VEGGAFSTYALKEITVGDEVEVMTPAGRFTLGPEREPSAVREGPQPGRTDPDDPSRPRKKTGRQLTMTAPRHSSTSPARAHARETAI